MDTQRSGNIKFMVVAIILQVIFGALFGVMVRCVFVYFAI